jgi:GNAT superfamily N-acetyltransferase
MEIVPFDGSQSAYRRRVALLKDAQPDEPWSVEGERFSDAQDAAAGRPGVALFAAVDGEHQGFVRFRTDPEDPAVGRRRLWLVVAHRARRRGFGSALLGAAGQAAAAQGATEFLVSTSLSEPAGLAFALAGGFAEVGGEVELHLDLGSPEPAESAALSPLPGLRLEALASLADRYRDWLDRYYRLYTSLAAGVLWVSHATAPDREAFRRSHVEAPGLLAEGTAVAVVGEEWVGLSELWHSGGDRATVYQELTGVLTAHRRRGIGAALVTATADWARRRGYCRLLGSTDLHNEAMQALARRLGFREAARWSYLVGPVQRRRVLSGREVHR